MRVIERPFADAPEGTAEALGFVVVTDEPEWLVEIHRSMCAAMTEAGRRMGRTRSSQHPWVGAQNDVGGRDRRNAVKVGFHSLRAGQRRDNCAEAVVSSQP